LGAAGDTDAIDAGRAILLTTTGAIALAAAGTALLVFAALGAGGRAKAKGRFNLCGASCGERQPQHASPQDPSDAPAGIHGGDLFRPLAKRSIVHQTPPASGTSDHGLLAGAFDLVELVGAAQRLDRGRAEGGVDVGGVALVDAAAAV